MVDFIPTLSVIAVYSALIPVVSGLLRFKSHSRDLRYFFYLMILNGVDSIAQFLLAEFDTNNHWVIQLYNVFEVPTMIAIYSLWFRKSSTKMVYTLLAILFALLWITSKFTFESLTAPSTYVGPISRVLLTILSVHALHEVSKDVEIPLLSNHRFWIASTSILYMSGAVMFYALQELFYELSTDIVLRIFYIYWSFIILVHISYSGAFLCKSSPQNSGGRSV